MGFCDNCKYRKYEYAPCLKARVLVCTKRGHECAEAYKTRKKRKDGDGK